MKNKKYRITFGKERRGIQTRSHRRRKNATRAKRGRRVLSLPEMRLRLVPSKRNPAKSVPAMQKLQLELTVQASHKKVTSNCIRRSNLLSYSSRSKLFSHMLNISMEKDMLDVICAHIWRPTKETEMVCLCDICNTRWDKRLQEEPRVVIGQANVSELLAELKS